MWAVDQKLGYNWPSNGRSNFTDEATSGFKSGFWPTTQYPWHFLDPY